MKKYSLTFALIAVVFAVCVSARAADAKEPLPRFKKNSVSIWLSPSNQINNIGFGDYRSEKERMNEVADVIEPILKKQGVTVYRNDPEESIRDYTRRANELNVDLYFAIHSNAANGKARGCETFCHKKGGEGERFAQRVLDGVMSVYDGPNRGVKEGYKFYSGKPMWETSASNMPACLVEIAFHDNETDSKWIIDNTKEIGEVLAAAVLEHLAAEHPDALLKKARRSSNTPAN